MAPKPNRLWLKSREQHNPLRGLTLARGITLLETYPRGEFADLMWTLGAPYLGIETADADLSAILDRRCSAVGEMDWNASAIVPRGGDATQIDTKLAAEQAAAIRTLMEGIPNLYAAIEHLALALCRGFAHCEIIEGPDGTPRELRPIDQWHIVRDGIRGSWRYNPNATQTSYDALGTDADLPADRCLIREVRRPLGRIALIKFIRCNLSIADWGAYVELYGQKNGVVVMPPDVGPEQEAAFLAACEAIAAGGSGALPHGATYTPNSPDKGSGTAPFEDHLKWWQQQLVLAGTNGLLTMLTESGSGTLAGGAHADTFETLARGDARQLSELINAQLVRPWLNRQFPNRPLVAEWALAFREQVDGSGVIEDAAKLSGAGYRMDPAELSEKTGYKITEKAPDSPHSTDPADPQPGDTPGTAMQMHANRPESENGTSSAPAENPPSESKPERKIANRKKSAKPKESAPKAPALGKLLAEVMQAPRAATWEQILAEAMEDNPEPGTRNQEPGTRNPEPGTQN